MNTPSASDPQWNQRGNAPGPDPLEGEGVFRLLFERCSDAIWLFDPVAGVFVDCNAAAVALMRCGSRDQLLQLRPEQLSPPTQADGRPSDVVAREVVEVAERQGGHRFEWVARRFDGTDVPLEVVVTSLTSADRRLQVVFSRDITERKRAEAARRESQHLLRSIADHINEALFRTGPAHDLMFVNAAYLRIFGYDSLEELRRLPREVLYADPAVRGPLLARLARDGRFSEEIEFVRKDGSRFWGLATSVALRDPQTDRVAFHVGTITDITELRQLRTTLERRIAERTAELSASEERLRTLVEHAPEAIVVFDGDNGRFLICNENATRLYGVSREVLLTLHPGDVSPLTQPDGRLSVDAACAYIDRALAGEAPVFEWMHKHSSGRLVPCEVRLVRLPGEGRNLVRGSVTDNTERKRREKVQQATFQISEAVHSTGDLAQLYVRIHEIIGHLMPARNFYIALFDAAADLISFPYHRDEFSPKPEPFQPGTGLTGYVLRSGQPLLVDRAMNARKRRVGDSVTFEGYSEISYVESGRPAAIWLGVPLRIGGRPLGVMAVQDYHDELAYSEDDARILSFIAAQTALAIDRKRAEEALRESEQKFRALFEASGQGVMLHDEHQFLEVNPATLRIMKFERAADLIGKHPLDTSPPTQPNGEDSAVAARRHIAECMVRGTARFEWTSLTAEGETVPLDVILTRVEMGGRQLIQAVIDDISERKKAEAELLRALAREKELSALKSNFVSMVSHEFRTPLGIIMSSAEILGDYLEQLDPTERREHLGSVARNARRMSELMEEVLVLGRLDAGRMEFRPAPADLRAVAAPVIEDVTSATEQACPILRQFGELPAEAQADERLLHHIFTNLLSNAVKYSELGRPVYFGLERDGVEVVITVRDEGIGIPEADQAWLFKAFHRGHNVGPRPGSGLGLVIVKRCVDLHGGKIRVESRIGQGTTVTVRLPVFPATRT